MTYAFPNRPAQKSSTVLPQLSTEELELSPVQQQLRKDNLSVIADATPYDTHNPGDSYCPCTMCLRERCQK